MAAKRGKHTPQKDQAIAEQSAADAIGAVVERTAHGKQAKALRKAFEERVTWARKVACDRVPLPIQKLGEVDAYARQLAVRITDKDRLAFELRDFIEEKIRDRKDAARMNAENMTYLEWMRAAQVHNPDAWEAGEDPTEYRAAREAGLQ